MRGIARVALVAHVASLFVGGTLYAQARVDSARIAHVADSIAAEVLKGPIAGVAVGVAHAGDIVFAKAYGRADIAEGVPLRVERPHQIGSLTKQFTAAAVLALVEEGRIALDDPIQKYLPDFDTQGHTVTIRHLLNHTSGIRSYTAIYGMNAVPRSAVLDTIQEHPFDFAPGERFLYNNSGYYLLGVILERVTGVPYALYMEQTYFDPLGLESTSYCGFEDEPLPVGYAPGTRGLEISVLSDMQFPGAAGGLCSTVDDLLDWQYALVTGRVVSPASYRRMTTATRLTSGDTVAYGFGLARESLEDHIAIVHGGGIPGFNTLLAWYPADSIGVAVLVNTAPGRPERVESAVARAALGLPIPQIADIPLEAAQRAPYLGTYQMARLQARVFEEDGRLFTQATGQSPLRMLYQGDDTFLLDAPQEIRLVFQLEDGRATGFVLHQGGMTIQARRIE